MRLIPSIVQRTAVKLDAFYVAWSQENYFAGGDIARSGGSIALVTIVSNRDGTVAGQLNRKSAVNKSKHIASQCSTTAQIDRIGRSNRNRTQDD